MPKSKLIIFIKNTIKGKVKTRLAKDLGDDKALEIYNDLLRHTHSISNELEINKSVYYSEYIEENDIWNEYSKDVQDGADLGERMSRAFKKEFANGNQQICIIGSDCYDLTAEIINRAFNNLEKYDFVVGPANDGGYYLLGMNSFHPELFLNKTYSTDHVFEEAIEEIENLKKTYFVLPELTDIDNISDLKKFQ